MSNHRIEQKHLFEEPDERWLRDDEWSFPKSVAIGWPLPKKTTPQDFRDFSNKYFAAMRAVCAVVNDNKIEDYVASYPIIFLFRHSVELALKAVILHQTTNGARGHDLSKLSARISGLPAWAEAWINELHRLDKSSTGLRYPDTDVVFFEAGVLMQDWLERTEKLHSVLITLSQTHLPKEDLA
jgi:hypothetical protein